MTDPKLPTPPDPLPPEERVLQIKSKIDAEESVAQAKKIFLRLLIGGLVMGVIASIALVQLLMLLDRTFNTDFAPSRPASQQNR